MSITVSRILSRPLTAPIIWTAYLAAPAGGWGWLDGIPLRPFESVALALVWWVWAFHRRLPGARALSALVVAKIALGGLFVDRGFEARYHANDAWAPPMERSTEFRSASFTRRDDRLAFGVEGAPNLPVYFFNDNRRFNFYLPTEPDRQRLGYSATWTGFLRVPDAVATRTFYIAGDAAAEGVLSVDGRQIVALMPGSAPTGSVTLSPGWHELNVRLAAPYGSARRLEAGEVIAGTQHPFDGSGVFVRPVSTLALGTDVALRWATRLADAAVLAWLVWLVAATVRDGWRERAVGRLLWLAAIVEAARFALPYAGRALMLSGGDDWLTYETYARIILLEDPLRGGQNGPLYYQPLYPYALALSHLICGEDLFGIIVAQRLLVAATIAWVTSITRVLFGPVAAWVALALGGYVLYDKLGAWSDVILTEPLFTALLVAWTWMLVRTATHRTSAPRLVATGILGGLATLTRSTLLVAWAVMLAPWAMSLRLGRTRAITILLVAMSATVATATLRNWVVADQFVLITTSGSINLAIGNSPSRPLPPPTPNRTATYDRLGLDTYTRGVAEYLIQQPGAFLHGLGQKALYAMGFFGLSGIGVLQGTSVLYVGTWMLALAGTVRLLRRSREHRGPLAWVPLGGSLSHFATVVLIFPQGYRDRLIVPLYPLLIPYAALALEPLALSAQPHAAHALGRIRAGAVAIGVGLSDAIARGVQRAQERLVPVLAPAARQPKTWFYLAYIVAVIAQLDWRPDDRDETALLTGLLLPITAIATMLLTRRALWHGVAGGGLFGVALVRVAMRGSLSPQALHDPLFLGAMAVVALVVSAGTGRWPAAAAVAAALAGALTVVALLLPVFPGFESSFPSLDAAAMRATWNAFTYQLGATATVALLALWVHAIVLGGRREGGIGRIGAAVRGALLAGLVLSLAGAVPTADGIGIPWIVALGILVGLAESRGR